MILTSTLLEPGMTATATQGSSLRVITDNNQLLEVRTAVMAKTGMIKNHPRVSTVS